MFVSAGASGPGSENVCDGSGVGGRCEVRRPRVGGSVIESGSSVESTYMVSARGAGATK